MRRLAPFLAWLAIFYSVWLVLITWGGGAADAARNWPMAVAMLFGSFVAGATPMGGGTVGFPILVMLFGQPASLGRDFSFAVQSIGMTSASIFILCRRTHLDWPALKGCMVGSLTGLPPGILFIAPLASPELVKMAFAVAWGGFGAFVLARGRLLAGQQEAPAAARPMFWAGVWTGLLSGLSITALTGVGVDMVIFMVLMLAFGSDLKTAVPTSVIVMAFNSLLGVAVRTASGGLQPGVYEAWLAAAPIVALGAPLGAFVLSRVGRLPAMIFVAILCVGQFAWALAQEAGALGPGGVAAALASLALLSRGFEGLRRRFAPTARIPE